MVLRGRDALIKGIREQLDELAEYDYMMGDISPMPRPWALMAGQYDDVRADPVADWIATKSLVIALAYLWGARDGAHAIKDDERDQIAAMVEELGGWSASTEEIARAMEGLNGVDADDITKISKRLFDKHVGQANG